MPTPPKNPKALNYKQEGNMLKFRQQLSGLIESKDPETATNHQNKLLSLYIDKQDSVLSNTLNANN